MNVMKRLVNRFLAWQLPKDFSPDAGISFKPTKPDGYGTHWWPTGTNLLTAEQAQKMFEHVIGDVSDYEASTEEEGDAFMHGYFCCKEVADTEITFANERIRELENVPRKYVQINGKGPTYCLHGTSSICAFEALEAALEFEKSQHVKSKSTYHAERGVADKLEKLRDTANAAPTVQLVGALREARRRMAEAHDCSLDEKHTTCRAALTDGMAEIDELLQPNAEFRRAE